MKTSVKILTLLLTVLLLLPLCACQGEEVQTGESIDHAALAATPLETESGSFQKTDSVTEYVCIQMQNGGRILIQLDSSAAPITVENFQSLVQKKFYDGLIFHRVIIGFMIQGGCPLGNGTGNPGYSIKGEFLANGVDNPLKHERGVISMARREMPNSAGCQFFIVHATSPHLDGDYAAFGKVIHGMDVVDAVASCATNSKDKPLIEQKMQMVYFMQPAA